MNDLQDQGRVPAAGLDVRIHCGVALPFVVAGLIGLVACQSARAQEDLPSQIATATQQYVERYVERVQIDARAKFLGHQNEAVDRPGGAVTASEILGGRLTAAAPEVRQAVSGVLTGTAQPVEQAFRHGVQELDREIREAMAAWIPLHAAICERRSLLGRIRAEQDSLSAPLLNLDDRWYWASLVLAWLGLAGVSVHAHRHGLRRRWGRRWSRTVVRGLLAAGFVLLACAVAGLGLADRLADASRRPAADDSSALREKIAAESARLESEIQQLTATVQTAAKVRARLQEVPGRRLAAAGADLSTAAAALRDRAIEIGERLAVLDALPPAIQADLDELAQVEDDLREAADAAARLRQWQRGLRGGIGLGTLGLVIAGAWLLRRGAKRRLAAVASTCPLCLGTIRATAVSRNGKADGAKIIRCGNVLDPARSILCDFAIRDAYRPMPKLCFPTLGVPRAGKTHWLAMAYWQLNRGNYPRSVRFERVRPVETASGEDFDRIVEQILISRLGTTGTQGTRIPHPLVFNFSDHDRWGPSNLLVNIFDYSGEVTAALGVDDYRRRRAMEADGYFFFLDPTLPAEPQAKALAEFREDLRLVKGVAGSRAISLPLALCVSKIDLLARQSYALPDGGDAVARFYEELAQIDPTGDAMTLDVIEARSRLTARLSATIWPGWQIERTVEDVFRGRSLFFPMTPVGLDGRGESDLNLRTIAPFGLLEPLAWLLHMNGYPVLG